MADQQSIEPLEGMAEQAGVEPQPVAAAQPSMQWYVLRAISGKEMKVKEMIDAARKNNDELARNIAQVIVPTEKVYTTRAGKKVLKDRILFSGYVFVQVNLRGDVESFLQNTSNVIDFVRHRESDRKPEPVSESEIERMLGAAEAEQAPDADSIADFIIGMPVKVNFGPFKDFTGEVQEINAERRELTVMVKVFGRETPLKLDTSQVERL